MIQKSYLINLKKRPERLAKALQQMERAQIQDPQIVEAVDGSLLPLPFDDESGHGALGCKLTHQYILIDAIQENLNCIAIYEDDAVMVDDFQAKLKNVLDNLPDDWEMLYLGTQHRDNPIYENPCCLRCTNCHRTHSIVYRGAGIRKVLQIWLSRTTGHIDHILGDGYFAELKAYACHPMLTAQGENHSDIQNVQFCERWWDNYKILYPKENCGYEKAARFTRREQHDLRLYG
jgi:GR25 family glycosyltransferase involved in LPS biosynthesis